MPRSARDVVLRSLTVGLTVAGLGTTSMGWGEIEWTLWSIASVDVEGKSHCAAIFERV